MLKRDVKLQLTHRLDETSKHLTGMLSVTDGRTDGCCTLSECVCGATVLICDVDGVGTCRGGV